MARYVRFFPGFLGIITASFMIGSSANALPVKAHDSSSKTVVQAVNLYNSDPYLELQRLLRPHFYFGGVISDAVRAATGDPNISVIDRRSKFGEVYECNFQFWGMRRQRVMICD